MTIVKRFAKNRRAYVGAPRVRLHVEQLETRVLLSAAGVFASPAALQPLFNNLTPTGLSPAQVKTAYNINQVGLTGAGQTIAIVDAYFDPNIASDLHAFDQKFGLPDPSLTQMVQTMGRFLPSVDAGWALETALDVEWAHAVAPGAKILLVESYDSSLTNLLSAVDFARGYAGVSTVSMSWGSSEFAGETSLDYHFTTPTGHSGVTFVASSGDAGAGVSWPAISPNVIGVGGTTLKLNANGYVSETGWADSGGGVSAYESKPSYQSAVTLGGSFRTSPDVAYDADPQSGVSVYDSVRYSGQSGWFTVGGTSAGAPQWAGLIALADQAHGSALDGASQTLPALYRLPQTDFHDITTGSNGMSAGVGYDLVTGRGTPIASLVVKGVAVSAPTAAAVHAVSTTTTHTVSNSTHPSIIVVATTTTNGAVGQLLSLSMAATATTSPLTNVSTNSAQVAVGVLPLTPGSIPSASPIILNNILVPAAVAPSQPEAATPWNSMLNQSFPLAEDEINPGPGLVPAPEKPDVDPMPPVKDVQPQSDDLPGPAWTRAADKVFSNAGIQGQEYLTGSFFETSFKDAMAAIAGFVGLFAGAAKRTGDEDKQKKHPKLG